MVAPGVVLPLLGQTLLIEEAAVRGPRVAGDRLLVPRGAGTGARVEALVRETARRALGSACDRHAATLGVRFGRITLRDTRSRWGSCSSVGDLMFSWRLALAPPEVLDYVAAHEVAHLERMDHSPAFWAVVRRLMPGYDGPRGWLRRDGAGLHRWTFRP